MEGCYYVLLLLIITLKLCPCNTSSLLHIITYYYVLLHIVAFANTLRDLVLTGPRASTPDVLDTPDDDVPEPYPQSPQETDVHERQKSQAAVTSLHQGAVLARLSVPITQMTAKIIEDMRGHYVVPDGDQDPQAGVE